MTDPLATWHSALASVATAPARALWVGDSAFEGTGSSNLRHRSIDLILDDLVASYPVAGYGRNEYLPAHYGWNTAVTPWGPDWYSSKSGTVTDYNGGIAGGSGNTTNTFGLGMRSSDMATSAILTYTVTGTDADIWTAAGGSYQLSIDGGAYGATVNTSAQNAYADNSQQVHLGSSGSHTIAIKCTAGIVHLLGFTIYDGGRDKGIVMFDSCHWGGMASSQYLSSDATLSAKFSRHVALVAPHLVIINVGLNDSNVYSKADVAANLQAMYEAILAQAPDASYMVLQNYDEVPDSDMGDAGYTYGEAKQTVVDFATNNDLPICYLSPPMPMASTDTGGYYTSDDEHMSDKGQALAETVISAFIDPLYDSSTTAVGNATASPATASGVASGSGSAMISIGANATQHAIASSVTTTGITTQATGSAFVMFAGCYPNTASFTVSDNKGNTYTRIGSVVNNSTDTLSAGMYYCANGAGGSGHTFAVSSGKTTTAIYAVEVKGAALSSVLDGNAMATSETPTAGPYVSGNITTTNANDALLAFILHDPETPPQDVTANTLTLLGSIPANSGGVGVACATQIASSTLTQQGSFSSTQAEFAIVGIVALKAAPSGSVAVGTTTVSHATAAAASSATSAASGAATVGKASAAGTGSSTATAAGAAIVSGATAAGVATASASTSTAVGAATANAASAAGVGAVTAQASAAATVSPATASAVVASSATSGTGAATVGQAIASGVAKNTSAAVGAATAGKSSASGVAAAISQGAGAAVAGRAVAAGVGTASSTTGSGAVTASPVNAAATAVSIAQGAGAANVSPANASGFAGLAPSIGVGSATVAPASAAGVASVTSQGVASATAAPVTGVGQATAPSVAAGAATAHAATAAGVASVSQQSVAIGHAVVSPASASGAGSNSSTGNVLAFVRPATASGAGTTNEAPPVGSGRTASFRADNRTARVAASARVARFTD